MRTRFDGDGRHAAWRVGSLGVGLFLLVLALGCGGGGGGDGTNAEDPSVEVTDDPIDSSDPADPEDPGGDIGVDAGYGRIVPRGAEVVLRASVDGAASVLWTQISGTAVDLANPTSETPSFVAPEVASSEILAFEVQAEDGAGGTAADQVEVEVWVPADDAADSTALGDFTARAGWACDVDPIETPTLSMSETDGLLTIAGNGIPAHATGTFPNGGNPNPIAAVATSYDVPLVPTLTDAPTEMMEFGITLDGIRMERDTGESYQNAGVWRYEAVTPGLAREATDGAERSWLGTDCNNAHVQPSGSYHYHGLPEGLINRLGEGAGTPSDMILGGYAADGHPFYLRYGYADPDDPESGLVVVEASWELREGTREDGPGGAYDGTFRQDWEFVPGSGDLDECGGRFGVTPEYPEGVYHYYLTDDYPYIPRCVFGTPDPSFRSLGGMQGPPA